MKNKPYAPSRLTPLEPTDPRVVALAAELGAKSLPRWRRFRCPCGVGSTQGEEHPASYSGASCLACGGSVKAFVEETSRPVVVCPLGRRRWGMVVPGVRSEQGPQAGKPVAPTGDR
jgi:hypothetical protein